MSDRPWYDYVDAGNDEAEEEARKAVHEAFVEEVVVDHSEREAIRSNTRELCEQTPLLREQVVLLREIAELLQLIVDRREDTQE